MIIQYALIVMDDQIHNEIHFASAIKIIFPNYTTKTIKCLCALIHRAGSATCASDTLERIEYFRNSLIKFGLECTIERKIE
jgi:ATP-dependent Clp protease adapter protein ClpS